MGDGDFRPLFEQLAPRIRAYAAQRLPASFVNDVVGDTFEAAWRMHVLLPESEDASRAWVFGIAKNMVLRAGQVRTRKHHDHRFAADLAVDEADPTDVANQVCDGLAGLWVLDLLTESERRTFDAAFLHGRDRDAAAEMLGISVPTLATRVSRLRARIAALLDEAAG
jgi:RNA polymerase sigma-70 factor (ECF subfamily)